MTGGPTSASTGSPLGRRSFIPGTPRFVRFIALLSGAAPYGHALSPRSAEFANRSSSREFGDEELRQGGVWAVCRVGRRAVI